MSAADKHRADAENYLRRGYEEDADFAALLVSMANASGLLAIEARLGELVEVLRKAHKPITAEAGPFVVSVDGDPADAVQAVADVYARAKQTLGGGR